jgi:branched-subunit amino acid aminotransferase/4-amino-4-deoxychorismate lyase
LIYTPAIECGVLPGITRGLVMKLAKRNQIIIKEVASPITALLKSDEAFITNSLRGIQPLVEVNRKKIGNGKTGSMTTRLQILYQDFLLKECGE